MDLDRKLPAPIAVFLTIYGTIAPLAALSWEWLAETPWYSFSLAATTALIGLFGVRLTYKP